MPGTDARVFANLHALFKSKQSNKYLTDLVCLACVVFRLANYNNFIIWAYSEYYRVRPYCKAGFHSSAFHWRAIWQYNVFPDNVLYLYVLVLYILCMQCGRHVSKFLNYRVVVCAQR